jgi:hypothetical protein
MKFLPMTVRNYIRSPSQFCSTVSDDDLAESFFLIPSSGEARTLRPNPLQKENDALKAEVETLRKRIADQDRALRARMDVDRELRDSIVVAKREVCIKKRKLLLNAEYSILGTTCDCLFSDASTSSHRYAGHWRSKP